MPFPRFFILVAQALLGGCALFSGTGADAPPVVPHVDLQRYTGTWFEIARYPHFFQKGCSNSTATYELRPDGTVGVVNRCWREDKGQENSVEGRAKVVDPVTNAKLKVTFFWPFYGDYWIIDLGRDYDYAVVTAPSRDYLWILARTPRLDPPLFAAILERLRQQGFDTTRLLVEKGQSAGTP